MVERQAGAVGNLGMDRICGSAMDRRKFCLTSVAAAISSAVVSVPAASAPSVSLYKLIYDRRYPAGRAFGAAAEHARSTAGIVAIDGDITALWSQDLRLQWSAGGGAIAGMTTVRTLLCLEQLARDHWKRVVLRTEHAISEGQGVVHQLSASEPMISRMTTALTAKDWPAKLPPVLTTCPRGGGGPRETRVIGPLRDGRFTPDEKLVSFVIA
jgi:hypothetical protein